jgi:2-dehydro-3-deoxyphosphogluconate aldolase/(4S)-4-hydroxy-2-oxoglutarate aldolase
MNALNNRISQIGVVPVIKLNHPERDAAELGRALCAGTVTATAQIDAVIEAGGDFIVSPGFDPELVAYAQEKGIAVYPGCTTASEYHQALKFGLEVIKFFPAEQSGGLAKIKALAAPFPMFKVMPTGGISLKNLKEYLSCPVIAACGGSYMVTAELIDSNRWDEITALCRKSREIVEEARA